MAEALHGPSLLRAFLKQHGLKQSDAARAIDVSAPTMHDWLDEAKRPRKAHRDAIEKWTGGAVPASAWETEDDRKIVDRVRPFAPAPSEAA